MTPEEQLPYWLQIVQALAPTTIAIVALIVTAWIQLRTLWTSRAKLRLDLFEQRFELLKVMTEIVKTIVVSGDNWVSDLSAKMREAQARLRRYRLLFPDEIGLEIDQLVKLCFDYATERSELEGLSNDHSDQAEDRRKEIVRRRRGVLSSIEQKADSIQAKVEKFIRVDWAG